MHNIHFNFILQYPGMDKGSYSVQVSRHLRGLGQVTSYPPPLLLSPLPLQRPLFKGEKPSFSLQRVTEGGSRGRALRSEER